MPQQDLFLKFWLFFLFLSFAALFSLSRSLRIKMIEIVRRFHFSCIFGFVQSLSFFFCVWIESNREKKKNSLLCVSIDRIGFRIRKTYSARVDAKQKLEEEKKPNEGDRRKMKNHCRFGNTKQFLWSKSTSMLLLLLLVMMLSLFNVYTMYGRVCASSSTCVRELYRMWKNMCRTSKLLGNVLLQSKRIESSSSMCSHLVVVHCVRTFSSVSSASSIFRCSFSVVCENKTKRNTTKEEKTILIRFCVVPKSIEWWKTQCCVKV